MGGRRRGEEGVRDRGHEEALRRQLYEARAEAVMTMSTMVAAVVPISVGYSGCGRRLIGTDL